MPIKRQTILCVDDDPAILKLLKAELEATNYKSQQARSGEQAIRILETHRIDLILLDLNMPGMNGFATLSHLKSITATKQIPVIILSAHGKEEFTIKGFRYGADDFIKKPFSGPILSAKIKAILRRSPPANQKINAIQGTVQDLNIFNLLQMLTFSDKSCVVDFPEMNGNIHIKSGDILSIRQSKYAGKEALVRLSLLNQGTFSVRGTSATRSTYLKTIPTDSLIFATAVRIDEIEEKIQQSIPASLLALRASHGDFEEISSLRKDFPLTPQQLSGKMPGNIIENVEQIAKAFADEVLTGIEA